MAVVVVTSLLAGALGAGLGAGAVIATDDEASNGSASTDAIGGVSPAVLPDGSVSKVAAKVLPSVVSIQFSGSQGAGSGSGVVIDDSGLMIDSQLVNRVERLKLQPIGCVQGCMIGNLVDKINASVGPLVPIVEGVVDQTVTIDQSVVDSPGVDADASQIRLGTDRLA